MENPYEPALAWIEKHQGTGSAVGLSKLILSLWNEEAAFSFRECVSSFDDIRSAWALKIISHFLKHGEDEFLAEAGQAVHDRYPALWDKGYAGTEGKRAWEEEWERRREENLRKEHPELSCE
jgi:hypothetical protein